MAAKKTAKKAAPAKPKAAKKTAKAAGPKTYKTLGALKAAKSKGTAPKGITVAMVAASIEFRVKGAAILTLNTADFVLAELKSSGFKLAPTGAPAPAAS